MDKKMPWNEKLESRYYFSNSELVCNVSTLSQLSLGLAIYIVYSFFSRQMLNALIGIGLGVISTYFLVCVSLELFRFFRGNVFKGQGSRFGKNNNHC